MHARLITALFLCSVGIGPPIAYSAPPGKPTATVEARSPYAKVAYVLTLSELFLEKLPTWSAEMEQSIRRFELPFLRRDLANKLDHGVITAADIPGNVGLVARILPKKMAAKVDFIFIDTNGTPPERIQAALAPFEELKRETGTEYVLFPASWKKIKE